MMRATLLVVGIWCIVGAEAVGLDRYVLFGVLAGLGGALVGASQVQGEK